MMFLSKKMVLINVTQLETIVDEYVLLSRTIIRLYLLT